MWSKVMMLCVLILASVHGPEAEAADSPLLGYWQGQLFYDQVPLEIHLSISGTEDNYRVLLDIPSLVYAGQEVVFEENPEGGYVLEFPFGLGRLQLALDGDLDLSGGNSQFSLALQKARQPERQSYEIDFGVGENLTQGTLILPAEPGPHPVIILIGGSAAASRESWSYASWAEFYLAEKMGVFIYDRLTDVMNVNGMSIPSTIQDHALNVADAIDKIKIFDSVDLERIGVSGSSRGGWIALALADIMPELAFFVFRSTAFTTPGEQEVHSILAGMRVDGLSSAEIDRARNYLRLYFYTAATGLGWELLVAEMRSAEDEAWFQYVDQPRTIRDLDWWRENMNFDTLAHLRGIKKPVLAIWGGADSITPWHRYRDIFLGELSAAGNTDATSHIAKNADHRLEIPAGREPDGCFLWFGIAPDALDILRSQIWAFVE